MSWTPIHVESSSGRAVVVAMEAIASIQLDAPDCFVLQLSSAAAVTRIRMPEQLRLEYQQALTARAAGHEYNEEHLAPNVRFAAELAAIRVQEQARQAVAINLQVASAMHNARQAEQVTRLVQLGKVPGPGH